jgi:hypothetical protein
VQIAVLGAGRVDAAPAATRRAAGRAVAVPRRNTAVWLPVRDAGVEAA